MTTIQLTPLQEVEALFAEGQLTREVLEGIVERERARLRALGRPEWQVSELLSGLEMYADADWTPMPPGSETSTDAEI